MFEQSQSIFDVLFQPLRGNDTIMKNGGTQHIITELQCMSAMKEYEDQSLEELRVEFQQKCELYFNQSHAIKTILNNFI